MKNYTLDKVRRTYHPDKVRVGCADIGNFEVKFEVNPPDKDTGCSGYTQVTEVEVDGVDIFMDLDAIPGAIEFLEHKIDEERKAN